MFPIVSTRNKSFPTSSHQKFVCSHYFPSSSHQFPLKISKLPLFPIRNLYVSTIVSHQFPLEICMFPLVSHQFPLEISMFPLDSHQFPLEIRLFPIGNLYVPNKQFPTISHQWFPLEISKFPQDPQQKFLCSTSFPPVPTSYHQK